MNEHFFDNYHDRGMKKWAGFYLSEHTAIMEKLKLTEIQLIPQKEQQSPEVISQFLETAILKGLGVSVQKEEVDQEGHYSPDITGKISGHDSLGVYIGKQKIPYDNIRHIDFDDDKKWSER
ncbi:hypothetical protein [uncultured Vagococcus sp.]|uniref:hypothetical protein n=1 Tax=uncultured Vagococcus sp. TaxID=189676 RepID=UPI0028D8F260|nr:hypothetical protein [uncultured Vagococcus sp.]